MQKSLKVKYEKIWKNKKTNPLRYSKLYAKKKIFEAKNQQL